MMRTTTLVVLLLTTWQATPALAADTDFGAAVFDASAGMDDSSTDSPPWRYTLSYDAGWDKNQQTVIDRLAWRLQWEGLLGKNNYAVVDAKLRAFAHNDLQSSLDQGTETQAKLNALYIQKSLTHSRWQVGYQVVNLGVMDILHVNDVLSPWDYSEPVFTAPEDARIGQPIVAWTWFGQAQQWDAYLNLAPDHNHYAQSTETKLAAQFGFSQFSDQGIRPAADHMELVLRHRSHHGPHEQQWLLGSLLQNDPGLNVVSPSTVATDYPRYQLLGYGYSYTHGSQQWKFEAAYKQGLQPIDAMGTKLDQVDSALGWEYDANGAYTLSIEAGRSDRQLPAGALPSTATQTTQVVGYWSKPFRHDTMKLIVYAGKVNPGPITTASISLSYNPVDNWYIELLSTQIDSKNSAFDIVPSTTSLSFRYHW